MMIATARGLVAAAAIAMSPSSWALYKCVGAGGATSFQEMPCERAQAQTAIKPLVEAPSAQPAGVGGAPEQTTLQKLQASNKQAETERLRYDAQNYLSERLTVQNRHRAACDYQQRQILSNRARANNNLAGATYEQSIATEAAAAATRCDTRGREIQADVEEARRQCAARGCT
jgi:hypothetical protein